MTKNYKIITAEAGSRQGGKNSAPGGFSLIEVIFSIFVISSGLMATMSLTTKNTKNSMDTRDSIVALQLAQEGIELVRNLRDNNWEAGRGSFDSGYFPTIDKSDCRIDYGDTAIACSQVQSGYQLHLWSDLYYQHDATGAMATKFFRKIKVVYLGGGVNRKATITSFVKWDGTMPDDLDTTVECVIADGCVYAEDVLTKWGE